MSLNNIIDNYWDLCLEFGKDVVDNSTLEEINEMNQAIFRRDTRQLKIYSDLLFSTADYLFQIEKGTSDEKGEFVRSKYQKLHDNYRLAYDFEARLAKKEQEIILAKENLKYENITLDEFKSLLTKKSTKP